MASGIPRGLGVRIAEANLIFDQDDTALIDLRFSDHSPQVGALESNRDGCDLQENE